MSFLHSDLSASAVDAVTDETRSVSSSSLPSSREKLRRSVEFDYSAGSLPSSGSTLSAGCGLKHAFRLPDFVWSYLHRLLLDELLRAVEYDFWLVLSSS
ncbi:unnamed protein product [Protopolystoma xenopodis]|uniref:Uncharacterized protein n=1 Tax=Protopolystoma xenopodis TaxID=117903 RepID=A0A3S5AYY9_9PLAT|nr:unnamed protein product [Protopolystoma xenopodis]